MDKTLQFLNNLPRVLDSEGKISKGPSDVVIQNTLNFLRSLPTYYHKIIDHANCITATGHGTITIDWYYRKNFISVEVGPDKIGWFSELPDGSNSSADGIAISEAPPAQIVKSLDKIYGRSDFNK